MTDSEAVIEAVRGHLAGSWPDRRHAEFSWSRGPISDVLPNFRVCRVSPLRESDGYIYLSIGASAIDYVPVSEFFITAAEESPRHIETLAMVAHYHSFPQHRLAHGKVLDIGRPWVEGSELSHLLVSWPYALDPHDAKVLIGDREVTFMWLVPITSAEADLVRTHGVLQLEELLEASNVNLLDPRRRSVV